MKSFCKSQIPNTKFQTNTKPQCSISKPILLLKFGIWIFFGIWNLGFGFSEPHAFAAQYDIKEMTPSIQQALAGRQSRYDPLQAFKSQGLVGENHSGYVEALGDSGEVQGLVAQENTDRRVIYQAIVEQNGLGPEGAKQVEAVFAEVQRNRAKAGESIQLPDGSWVKK